MTGRPRASQGGPGAAARARPSRRATPGAPARLAAVVLLALAAAPAAGEQLVRLVAPAAATPLVAGSRVTVEWQPGPALPAFADEWEVFLSLDGGRTYLARLTPHLDLDVRRVEIRLPDVPSEDARLMLRMGDERVEREQELPGRYRIVPAAVALPDAARLRAAGRGEAARPRAPGVTRWVEGRRDGGGWVERHAGARQLLVPGVRAVGAALLAPVPVPRPVGVPAPATGRSPVCSPAPAAHGLAPATPAPPCLSRLCRRNL